MSIAPPPPSQANSKAKFELGKKVVSEDEKRQQLMDRMFSTAKEVDSETEKSEKTEEEEEVAEEEWDE